MMQTEAFVLIKKGEAGQAFQKQTISLKDPEKHEVRIAVTAFGLNYADVMARRGLYREAPPMPCVIGYEVVGMIEAVGSDVDQTLIGKRVVAFCRFGAYAKHVVTPAYACAEIEGLSDATALALATQGVTAHYMLHRSANIYPGERVLIHAAAGGVGNLLIQMAKNRGAFVIAKVSSDAKAERCLQLGADAVVNYKKEPYDQAVQNILKTERLDASFNPVAGSTFKKDWAMLGTGGRLVLFGGSELGKGTFGIFTTLGFVWRMGFVIPIGLMMRSKSMIGVNMLKVADNKQHVLTQCMQEVVEMAKKGEIDPLIGNEFNEDAFEEAHDLLESGKSIGKLIVRWS
jgi:NADPH:quinone reductase-like Zn-dependent oxidoreductase